MTKPLRVVGVSPLLQSYVFDVERRVVSDGEISFERDIVTHRGAVAMLAIDADGRVGMIHQYRATVDHELWEIPAGTIDSGETDPLAVAHRELREEIGCTAATWQLIGRFLNSPGWTNQQMYVYAATDLTVDDRAPMGPEEERAQVEWLEASRLRALLNGDEPLDSTTALALQWYFLHRADR